MVRCELKLTFEELEILQDALCVHADGTRTLVKEKLPFVTELLAKTMVAQRTRPPPAVESCPADDEVSDWKFV